MKKFILPAFVLLMMSFTACDLLNPEEESDEIIIDQNITTPTTWLSSKTYVVENGIDVDGTTLTIEPGTVIKFKAGAYISFGYNDNVTLVANGTAEKPIIFTAHASNPAPGSWDGVWFYSNTLTNSSMTYCEVNYAGQNNHAAITLYEKITMNNCTVKDAENNGIYSEKGFISFNGNTIEEVGSHAIEIEAIGVHTLGTNNAITCDSNYGILVNGGHITLPTVTWTEQVVPYYIDGGISFDQTFTIQPGVTLKFHAGAYFDFGYYENTTFTAVGTIEKPITFTSAASTPAAGAWPGLFFYTYTTSNSIMKYCTVEFGGKDYSNANITLYEVTGLTIENCTIRNSSGWGIHSTYSTWNDLNNTYSNNANGNVYTND